MIGKAFPKMTARNLDGRAYEIPRELDGNLNLVVLAFLREHQEPVETWLPHLGELRRRHPGLEVWEVPALSRRYRIWRSAIDSGMRAGIADPAVRSHTLTSYIDLHALQRALGLADLEEIRLYLLDRRGMVLWEAAGGYDATVSASLDSRLSAILGGSS